MATKRTGYGQEPKASPLARVFAVILGLLLLAVTAVVGRELWILYGDADASSWITPLTDALGTEEMPSWLVWAGVAAVVVGILLLLVALKPRSRTHRALNTNASAWMRPVDIARLASATAQQLPGAHSASSSYSGNTLKVAIVGDANDASLPDRAKEAIGSKVAHLAKPPKISVTVENDSPQEALS